MARQGGQQSFTPNHQHQRQQGAGPRGGLAKVVLPVSAIVVVAVVVAVILAELRPWDSSGAQDLGSGSKTDPARLYTHIPAGETRDFPISMAGMPGTPQGLASTDPKQLYWAMLKNQITQQVLGHVQGYFDSTADYISQFPSQNRTEVEADFRSRKYSYNRYSYDKGGQPSLDDYGMTRCVDGEEWVFKAGSLTGKDGWRRSDSGSSWENDSNCKNLMSPERPSSAHFLSTDGIAPSGLSSSDADKYISYLDHVPGLVTARDAKAIQGRDGRQYVQLDVDYNSVPSQHPQEKPSDALNSMGMAYVALLQADGKTIKNWPFDLATGIKQGRAIRYYIDPATLLPAHSVQMNQIPILKGGGVNQEPGVFKNGYVLNTYEFPQQLDQGKMVASGTPSIPPYQWPFPQVMFK